jgi:hypothetical protein
MSSIAKGGEIIDQWGGRRPGVRLGSERQARIERGMHLTGQGALRLGGTAGYEVNGEDGDQEEP